jgi:hypothetical protein
MNQTSTRLNTLPPGIVYLSLGLLWASIYSALAYLIFVFARYGLNIETPTWLVTVATILALPLAKLVSANWTTYKDNKNAQALGAIAVPLVPCKWLGGLDIVADLHRTFQSGYLGRHR